MHINKPPVRCSLYSSANGFAFIAAKTRLCFLFLNILLKAGAFLLRSTKHSASSNEGTIQLGIYNIYMTYKMREKILLSFLIVSISVFCANNGDDFKYIGLGNKGEERYLKIDQQTDEYSDVWNKEIHPKRIIRNKKGEKVTVGGNYEMTLLRIYCKDKSIAILASYSYNKNGEMSRSYEPSEYQIEKMRVIPDSLGEYVFDLVCGNGSTEP